MFSYLCIRCIFLFFCMSVKMLSVYHSDTRGVENVLSRIGEIGIR